MFQRTKSGNTGRRVSRNRNGIRAKKMDREEKKLYRHVVNHGLSVNESKQLWQLCKVTTNYFRKMEFQRKFI